MIMHLHVACAIISNSSHTQLTKHSSNDAGLNLDSHSLTDLDVSRTRKLDEKLKQYGLGQGNMPS